MSIATEIERLQTAKTELKTAIENRGGVIGNDITIDEYGKILSSKPYAIKGTFTPESDTRRFAVEGLPFAPELVYLYCYDLFTSTVLNSIGFFTKPKGKHGVCHYVDQSGTTVAMGVVPNTSVESWTDTGYEINFPSTFAEFKTGYTYDYYVIGGFTE